MDTSSPNVKSVLPAAITLAVIGWGGLVTLVFLTLPTVGPRWLFFFLGVLGIPLLIIVAGVSVWWGRR